MSKPRPNRQTACDLCRIRRVKCDAMEKSNGWCTKCWQRNLKCTFDYKAAKEVVRRKTPLKNGGSSSGANTSTGSSSGNVGGGYDKLTEDMRLRLAESARYCIKCRENFVPTLKMLAEGPWEEKGSLFRKVEECIGSLWCVDQEILGVEVVGKLGDQQSEEELEVDSTRGLGRLSEEVLNARRKLHGQLYDELIEMVDSIIQANQTTSLPVLAGLLLFTSITPPTQARRIPKYTMSMIEEWLVRRVHIESAMADPNEALRQLLISLYHLDCFVCLFTGKLPAIRPTDIFLPEEMKWGDEPPPAISGTPGKALRDSSIIEHELFDNFIYARAVYENRRTNPAPRFEKILNTIRTFRGKYADLLCMHNLPLMALTMDQTIERLIHILYFYNVVLRLWEISVTVEERCIPFTDIDSLNRALTGVKYEAIKCCIDGAKAMLWCMRSGRELLKRDYNASELSTSPVKSAIQYDPGMVCVFCALAIKALKTWRDSVPEDQIISWYGQEYIGWDVSETINIYISTLYEASEIQEQGRILYMYYRNDLTSTKPEEASAQAPPPQPPPPVAPQQPAMPSNNNTENQIKMETNNAPSSNDPIESQPTNDMDLNFFTSVPSDPFYTSFQHTWDSIQWTLNAINYSNPQPQLIPQSAPTHTTTQQQPPAPPAAAVAAPTPIAPFFKSEQHAPTYYLNRGGESSTGDS